MKRILALGLSVLLLVGLLAGCGGGDKNIVGTWEMSLDMVDMLNEELSTMGMGDAMRLSAFVVTMDFTFKSDGTYTCEMDTDAFQTTMDTLKSELRTGFTKYIEDLIAAQGVNMSIDDFFAMSGTTLDEALEQAFSADSLASMADELAGEGNYETKGGKLYLSDGLDYRVDPEAYYTYTIDGDSMSFLSAVGTDEDEFSEYFPIQLTKIG